MLTYYSPSSTFNNPLPNCWRILADVVLKESLWKFPEQPGLISPQNPRLGACKPCIINVTCTSLAFNSLASIYGCLALENSSENLEA